MLHRATAECRTRIDRSGERQALRRPEGPELPEVIRIPGSLLADGIALLEEKLLTALIVQLIGLLFDADDLFRQRIETIRFLSERA